MEIGRMLKRFFRSKSMSLIFINIAVIIFFYLLNNNYLNKDNIRGMMNTVSTAGILGVGVAFLLMGGGMDLAAGAEGCFGAVVVALLMRAGIPWPIAILLGLVFGIIAGGINSFFVNKLNFMGFITTLGMSSIYGGLSLVISNNNNIAINDQTFWKMGSYAVFGIFPMPFVIMVFLIIIYGFILAKTRFGRSILMCGGNRQAARLAGLNPKRIVTILYMNCAMLATLSGSVLAARMHNASPTALSSAALSAITASVLGGVSFMGGGGNISGLFFGLLLLNSFNNGLIVIEVPSYWQVVTQGGLLIIALCVDFFSTRARDASLKKSRMTKTA